MELDQDFTLRRGEDVVLRTTIAGQAEAQIAQWFLAPQRESLFDEHVLDLDSSGIGGVTLTTDGDNLIVDVRLTAAATEAMTPGTYHHELWLEDVLDQHVCVAEGAVEVLDSLIA